LTFDLHLHLQAELEKRQVKVDQLSAEIEWDQKAVAAVRSATKDEETDIEMMAKYFTLDENAIKVEILTLPREIFGEFGLNSFLTLFFLRL